MPRFEKHSCLADREEREGAVGVEHARRVEVCMYVDFSLSFSVALSLKKNRLDLQGAACWGGCRKDLRS